MFVQLPESELYHFDLLPLISTLVYARAPARRAAAARRAPQCLDALADADSLQGLKCGRWNRNSCSSGRGWAFWVPAACRNLTAAAVQAGCCPAVPLPFRFYSYAIPIPFLCHSYAIPIPFRCHSYYAIPILSHSIPNFYSMCKNWQWNRNQK